MLRAVLALLDDERSILPLIPKPRIEPLNVIVKSFATFVEPKRPLLGDSVTESTFFSETL